MALYLWKGEYEMLGNHTQKAYLPSFTFLIEERVNINI
jgi:hypothetical protein